VQVYNTRLLLLDLVSGLPAVGSDSAKFSVVSSAVVAVVLSTMSSFAVLDKNLIDAVLSLVTAFTETQLHVSDCLVLLHSFMQLPTAALHTDHPQCYYHCTNLLFSTFDKSIHQVSE